MKSMTRRTDSLAHGAIRHTVAAFLASARVGAAGTLAGWPVLLGRSLFYVVCLLVLTALWDKVAAEHLPGAIILPAGGLALYVGATEWITLSTPAVQLRLEDDIRLGALEAHLLRPKPYLSQRLAESIGALVARLLVTGLTAAALLIASGRAMPPLLAYPSLAVLGVLGGVICVLLYAIAGLSAFWVRKTLPAMLIIQKLMFLLGGLFAPITFYPGPFRQIAEASPFAAGLYWPAVQVLHPSLEGFGRALGWQLLWIAVLIGVLAAIWSAGLRKVLRDGI